MLSRLQKDSTFKVLDHRSFSFDHNETGSATLMSDMANFGGPQLDELWKPQHMDLSYGLAQDPTDIEMIWALQWRDIGDLTPPITLITTVRSDSVWQASQRWRLVGAGTGVIQTMDQIHHDFDREAEKAGTVEGPRNILVLLGGSGTTAALDAAGVISIDVEITQVNMKDDFDEYEFDFLWEESYSEEDSSENQL